VNAELPTNQAIKKLVKMSGLANHGIHDEGTEFQHFRTGTHSPLLWRKLVKAGGANLALDESGLVGEERRGEESIT